jgi:hypothetical protein
MAKNRGPGRPPIEERLLVRLPKGTLRQIKAVLEDQEKQADFARTAIAAELARRERRGSAGK